jgi:thioredoxin-related protein
MKRTISIAILLVFAGLPIMTIGYLLAEFRAQAQTTNGAVGQGFQVAPVPLDDGQPIATALKAAKHEGKHVLVQSSARGCGWCHELQKILTTDPEILAKIKSDYEYVIIDTTDSRDFYKQYAENTDHTLVMLVLDADGHMLARKIGFDIVEGNPTGGDPKLHISPEHTLEFLKKWGPQK